MFNLFNNYNSTGNRPTNYIVEEGAIDNFETLQKARQDLVGEIQAVIEYDDHLHSSTDTLAKETWKNIKNEELTHVGELLGLINNLDPSQKEHVQNGLNEFLERMNKK